MIICIRGVLRSSMHSTKTIFRTVPDSKWLKSTWEPKIRGKAVKWDNSHVPPVAAASQSHTRPTCTVLRIFLALLALSFALWVLLSIQSQAHHLENLFMASLWCSGSSVLHHVFELMHMQAQELRNASCRGGEITLGNEWEIKIKYSANECFYIQS